MIAALHSLYGCIQFSIMACSLKFSWCQIAISGQSVPVLMVCKILRSSQARLP